VGFGGIAYANNTKMLSIAVVRSILSGEAEGSE